MGIVYLTNKSGTPIATGTAIPMLTIERRHNSFIDQRMNLKCGYYRVSVNATLGSTAGGDGMITLYQDGTAIASSAETIVANRTINLTIDAVVKSKCCGSTLTIVYDGVALTSTVASVVIENA